MRLTTLELLTYSPTEALLVIANETLDLSVNPNNVTLSDIRSLGGTETEVTITAHYNGARPINPEFVANPYEGHATLRFNRLDLGTVMGDNFTVALTVPTTVNDVLDAIREKTGVRFDEDDFAQDRIDTSEFLLSALPQSKRWVGGVHLVLIN
jgi:hypothetical protein